MKHHYYKTYIYNAPKAESQIKRENYLEKLYWVLEDNMVKEM